MHSMNGENYRPDSYHITFIDRDSKVQAWLYKQEAYGNIPRPDPGF